MAFSTAKRQSNIVIGLNCIPGMKIKLSQGQAETRSPEQIGFAMSSSNGAKLSPHLKQNMTLLFNTLLAI